MSMCTAETLAQIKALKVIMENEWKKVIICADSRSALECISNINFSYKLDHDTIYCKQILAQLQSQWRTIEFIWIPSHTYIDSNETKSHHSRRAIVTMNRLRSGHSSVKDHLYRIGMADAPLCACRQTQTALHVLFECTNYLDACNELFI